MQAGGGGVCMGRQVFSHQYPDRVVTALKEIVHNGLNVSEAMEIAGL